MGCDIHLVLEMKHGDRWIGVHSFPAIFARNPPNGFDYRGWTLRGRNYEFFAALAGVRGEGPEPRGLPDDLSELSQAMIDSWGVDGHSHTWYTLEEIAPIVFTHLFDQATQNMLAKEKLKGQYDPNFIADMAGVQLDGQEHRLIIWFDN